MLWEITSSLLVGGALGYFKLKNGKSDHEKIEKIAKHCGLTVKEEKRLSTIQLLRKDPVPGGMEYAYRIPLGLSFKDFENKLSHFQDGLNNKKTLVDVGWNDIKELSINRNIPGQVRQLLEKKSQLQKEIEMKYDGTMKITVYNQPLTTDFPYIETHGQGWSIPIGTTRQKLVSHDTDKYQMMIVAGITRYGKTVFLKMMITDLIHKQPKNVHFTLLDLKGGLAFNRFKNCSQVVSVASDAIQALKALENVQKEMEKQMNVFLSKGYEDIKEAGIKERHFIIVDEGAELASKGETDPEIKKVKIKCESILSDIARRGAGIGYRLIFCTQYPTMDTIPRQVKRNSTAILSFPLDTDTASETVLDEKGAESLPLIPGRAIYKTDRKQIIQTPFITNEQISKLIQPHIRKEPTREHREVETRRIDPVIFEETGLSKPQPNPKDTSVRWGS